MIIYLLTYSNLIQRNTPIKAAASGAFAGGVSVLLFQGIDVIKSRMQGLDAGKYRSTMHCFTDILKNEGPLAFYKVTRIDLLREVFKSSY